MGSNTVKPLTPTLTLLNIRLGYWLRNPGQATPKSWFAELRARLFELTNLYFFQERLGWLEEDSWYVYVTDGAHIENLGMYQLLKRRCRLIIAVDVEADPAMHFGSFVRLQRHARIDLGIRIDLPWQQVRATSLEAGKLIEEGADRAAGYSRGGPHCAIGLIHYPNNETGYLLYIKASLTADENDDLLDYKRRYPLFPHEATSDQMFTEEQFEIYRALGFHAAFRLFNEFDGDAIDNAAVYSEYSPAGILKHIFADEPILNEVRSILAITGA
jgi:hypothetical protein